MSSCKVMIFIDGSNLFWACRQRTLMIDYGKLRDFLVDGRTLIRAYFYGAEKVPIDARQQGFYEKLKFDGFEVKTKPLVKRTTMATLTSDGSRVEVEKEEEKGVDVALVTDMLSMGYKNAYDVAISVGADADFESAVRNIKDIPKRVELAAFSDNGARYASTVCREMRMVADKFIPLEKHIVSFQKT